MSKGIKGIKCPNCDCRHFVGADGRPEFLTRGWTVTNTYNQDNQVRRRRVCRNCGHVINTIEVIEKDELNDNA